MDSVTRPDMTHLLQNVLIIKNICRLFFQVLSWEQCHYDTSFYYKSHTGFDCQSFAVEMTPLGQLKSSIVEPLNVLVKLKEAITHCHICEKPWKVDVKTIRAHFHHSGYFCAFAHSGPCNIDYQEYFFIPSFSTVLLSKQPDSRFN